MSDQPYLSIATATFMSEADFEAFRAKATTFSSEKALAYLKENDQTNFSIIRAHDDQTVRAVVIWEYENQAAWERCQEYWNSWFKYEDNYIAKGSFVRGNLLFDWDQAG